MCMFKTLSKTCIYRFNNREVVWVSFDHTTGNVRVRDMSGNYEEVPV